MTRNSQTTGHSSQLDVVVDGYSATVSCGRRKNTMQLKKQPLLLGIIRAMRNTRTIKGIEVRIINSTFSTTRQVVATVNTLAWVWGVKVNGKRQISARYDHAPNITMPKRRAS